MNWYYQMLKNLPKLNQVFAGDIQGVFLSGEYVNITKTSLAPTTKIENNLQLAVLSTATYLYEKEQERS